MTKAFLWGLFKERGGAPFWNVASPAPLKSLVLRQYNRELRGKATKPSLPTCLSLIVLDYSVLQPENAHFTDYIDEIDTEDRTRRKGNALSDGAVSDCSQKGVDHLEMAVR